MRKIEQQIANAIRAGKPFKGGNTEVLFNDALVPGGVKPFIVVLHGHMVAYRNNAGTVTLDWCGYSTPTTRSRLNVVCDALNLPVYAGIKDYIGHFYDGSRAMVGTSKWVSEPGVGQ